MTICGICSEHTGFESYDCTKQECKFIKQFIKEHGYKKTKEILEWFRAPDVGVVISHN